MLIDSHAHITDEAFGGEKNVIDTMTADNLEKIVCVGCDVRSSLDSVRAAEEDKRVFCAVGVHPYYPEEVTADALTLFETLAAYEKTVAIGEIGLDYHNDGYDRDAQLGALSAQYELAIRVGLPMIFHVREATGDFTEFVRDRAFPQSAVMHCFSGSCETAEFFLKKGFYISFSGKITYKNSKRLKEAAAIVPLDRLLIETDAPYLTPAQKMGELNHPKYVAYVRDCIAEIKGVSADEVERATALNAKKLFFKMGEYEKRYGE